MDGRRELDFLRAEEMSGRKGYGRRGGRKSESGHETISHETDIGRGW
jgi:hypothetical protein